jgi:hypothetical protein
MVADDIIAKVKRDFQKYVDAGLVDEDELYRDLVFALKKFGNDITYIQETVVEVKDGYAQLPKSFFSLYLAYLCEPLGFKVDNVEFHDLQSSHYYVERTKQTSKWNECDACCDEKETSVIRENLYFNSGKVIYYYTNPTLLRLGKAFKKDSCHADCRNKIVRDNPNEIVIVNFRLQANFNEGNIYLQYYGLPTDEDGNIEVPESANGHLELYIEYYLKRRLTEVLMGNNDAQGLANLYSVFAQQESINLRKASNELKMANINPKSLSRRIQRLNRLESLQYESNLAW